jgi:hypothetical protein
MSDEIMETEVGTEATATESQGKMFSQSELDRIVADRIAREQRKFEKQLSGIDISEARQLLQDKEAAELERQKERGDFESVLKKTVEKKDQEISAYKSKLQSTLVDGALLSAASSNNAVNPEQVSALLRSNLRLSDDGSVEVLDSKHTTYNEKSVSGELVAE